MRQIFPDCITYIKKNMMFIFVICAQMNKGDPRPHILPLVRPKKNNCLVVLHNFFGVGVGGGFFFLFFFFKSKSNLHGIIAFISQ